MNEPGAWSPSLLSTPDTEGAASFYDVARDGLLRLTAHESGVAGMTAGDGQANWSVDFWTEDADATAETAKELGGSVVAGPFDTPVGRTAVVADREGAVFSVSTVAAAI